MVTYIGIHRKYSDTFKTHHSERPQVKLWEIDPNKLKYSVPAQKQTSNSNLTKVDQLL